MLTAEHRGTSRALGGLLVAAGVLVALIRRSEFENPWSDFVVLLVLIALVETLFWSGYLGARWSDATRPWHTIYMLVAIVLTPVMLFEFVSWIDGDTGAPLNAAWIFLVTAGVAGLALVGAGVRVAALLAAVAVVVAWAALWQELVDDGLFEDIDSLRWVLLASLAPLLALAGLLGAARAPDGSTNDVITVAGAAAVLAGGVQYLFPGLFIVPEGFESNEATSLFWDIELLVASLLLVGIATSGALTRAPGYIGGFGLAVFVITVGLDLDDSSPSGKVLGWPLILLLAGAILVLASVLPELRRRRT